jgi:protein SCO1/2
MSGVRRVIDLTIACVVIAALAVGIWILISRPQAPTKTTGPKEIGGHFSLIDQNGHKVTDEDLKGKPNVFFFGYTNSPEVSPTTLADLTAELKTLGPDADKLNVLFVTLDPARDTTKRMAEYLRAYDPHIRGLTGTPAEIREIAQDYAIYYAKIPERDGSYSMDHSYNTYLIGANGHLFDVVGYPLNRVSYLSELRKLIRQGSQDVHQ